jgi:hypothetical protein
VLADLDTAPIDEKLRETLRFLRKVTLDPGHVDPDDVRPLRRLGVSRQAVEDALAVAFFFNLITRLADAFGWDVESDAGFQASAKMLLGKGYLMPMRGKRQAELDARAR